MINARCLAGDPIIDGQKFTCKRHNNNSHDNKINNLIPKNDKYSNLIFKDRDDDGYYRDITIPCYLC